MKNRFAALFMAVLLLLYIVVAGQRAVLLFEGGTALGIAGGCALIVFPLIAIWALGRELWFGFQTEKLVKVLAAEGALPVETAVTASGRAVREVADEEFPRYKAEVEAAPESWRAWFRLGLAYDASGDRRRARWALREAIKLSRSAVSDQQPKAASRSDRP
ncbi:tetratricopeptide repeat protein [Gryllotalpicola daejeonensis]|uniref:Tetratricopeptide repeat protein n=1 Tax=Gryllotalpicola daejeonensis TaxID=993087 RepID=A0ABP7ZMF3_9MICO